MVKMLGIRFESSAPGGDWAWSHPWRTAWLVAAFVSLTGSTSALAWAGEPNGAQDIRGRKGVPTVPWRPMPVEGPETWCAAAAAEDDVARGVTLLEDTRARFPDSPVLAGCYARALAAAGRLVEALASLERFRDRRDHDPETHRVWIDYLWSAREGIGGDVAIIRRVLGDQQADVVLRRRLHAPTLSEISAAYEDYALAIDGFGTQLTLLKYRMKHGPDAEVDRILKHLGRWSLTLAERHEICQALNYGGANDARVTACWRSLAGTSQASDGEGDGLVRMIARIVLVGILLKAHDWSGLDTFLEPFSPVDRLRYLAFQRFTEEAVCAEFRRRLAPGLQDTASATQPNVHDWRRIASNLVACGASEEDPLLARVREELGTRAPAVHRSQDG